MSLKDDIEDITKVLKYEPPTTLVLNAKESLSRIESALALDDGMPREGDAVAYKYKRSANVVIITRYGTTPDEEWHAASYEKPVLLMRAEEVERRIKEAGE